MVYQNHKSHSFQVRQGVPQAGLGSRSWNFLKEPEFYFQMLVEPSKFLAAPAPIQL